MKTYRSQFPNGLDEPNASLICMIDIILEDQEGKKITVAVPVFQTNDNKFLSKHHFKDLDKLVYAHGDSLEELEADISFQMLQYFEKGHM